MPKNHRRPVKFARIVPDEELKPFFDRRKEDGFNPESEQIHNLVLADYLEENGDPRHHIIRKSPESNNGDDFDFYNDAVLQDHALSSEEERYRSSTHPFINTDLWIAKGSDNDKRKPIDNHIVVLHSNIGGYDFFSRHHPEDAHSILNDMPGNKYAAKGKKMLEDHFPELKSDSSPSPEKMNRKKVKMSRIVPDKELKPFEDKRTKDVLASEGGWKDISSLHENVLADYLEENGDPRHALIRNSLIAKGIDLLNHRKSLSNFSGEFNVPYKGPNFKHFIFETGLKKNSKSTDKPLDRHDVLITSGIGNHSYISLMHPREFHEFLSSFDDEHLLPYKKALENHFPELKSSENQPEKMKRKKVKMSRIVPDDEIMPFHISRDDAIHDMPDDWRDIMSLHNNVLADYLEENGDPRHILIRNNIHNKGINIVDFNNSHHHIARFNGVPGANFSHLSFRIKKPFSASENSNSIDDHNVIVTSGIGGWNYATIMHPKEFHEFLSSFDDEHLLPYKKALEKHFPELKQSDSLPSPDSPDSPDSPEKMKRKKVKFGRLVTKSEMAPFGEKLSELVKQADKNDIPEIISTFHSVISDHLQDQGDPRWKLINKRTNNQHDNMNETHRLTGFAYDYLGEGGLISLSVYHPKNNHVSKKNLQSEKPKIVISSHIGHPHVNFGNIMSPEDAYSLIHEFPDGPPENIKNKLESHFPHLKTNNQDSPAQMNKQGWKSRYRKAIAYYLNKR